jgi:hypothetical protein
MMDKVLELTPDEANLIREWFNSVQDLNHKFLGGADYSLAKRIHEYMGMQVSKSIERGIEDASCNAECSGDCWKHMHMTGGRHLEGCPIEQWQSEVEMRRIIEDNPDIAAIVAKSKQEKQDK